MRIALIGKNRYLWQKLRLLLPEYEILIDEGKIPPADRVIWDFDTAIGDAPDGAIVISRKGRLTPGFTRDEIISALGMRSRLSLSSDTRTATLDGRVIKLTELEFNLLFALHESEGEYVPRAQLIERIWGDSGNDGLINLYIHYLREKLETGSERLIFSSRKDGYMLKIVEEVKKW